MIVVLKGAPRSGKSSIVAERCAAAIEERLAADPPASAFARLATFLA